MQALMKQQLEGAIRSLADRLKTASTYLTRLTAHPSSEEEAILAVDVEMEIVHLDQRIGQLKDILDKCESHIAGLATAEQREDAERTLASFPVFIDELISDSTAAQWPVIRLQNQANEVRNKLRAYLTVRPKIMNASSHHSLASNESQAGDATPPIDQQLIRDGTGAPTQPEAHNATMLDNLVMHNSPPFQFDELEAELGQIGGNAQGGTNGPILHQHRQFPTTVAQQRNPYPQPSAPLLPRRASSPRRDQDSSRFNPWSALKVENVKLPKFGGDIREWRTFWAAFENAVHRQPYDAFQKHLLLLQQLKENSPARDAISGYPPTDENYNTVVQILKTRYGDDKELRDYLQSQLLKLEPVKDDLRQLTIFGLEVERLCLQMESLGDTSNDIIYNIIKSKLPRNILLKLVEMESGSGRSWTQKDLRNGLSTIIRLRQSVETSLRNFQGRTDECQREARRPHPGQPTQNREQHRPAAYAPPTRNFQVINESESPSTDTPSSRNFQVVNESATPPPENRHRQFCSLCNSEGHKPSRCTKYATSQQRKERLRQQGRCLRCLKQNHRTDQCNKPTVCTNCNARDDHHFIICPKPIQNVDHPGQQPMQKCKPPSPSTRNHFTPLTGANAEPLNLAAKAAATRTHFALNNAIWEPTVRKSASSPIQQSEERETETVTMLATHATPSSARKEGLLMTITISVSCHGGPPEGIPAIVFFDPGSQTSYITADLVERLQPKKLSEEQLRLFVFGSQRPRLIKTPTFSIWLKGINGDWEKLEMNSIADFSPELDTYQWDGDDNTGQIRTIRGIPKILIGTEFWNYFTGRTLLQPGIHLIRTVFGNVIGGKAEIPPQRRQSIAFMAIHPTNEESLPLPKSCTIDQFLSIEGIGITDDPTANEDEIARKLFDEGIRQLPNGRYMVKLPWRNPRKPMPSNWAMAYSRLRSTLRRLSSSPELLDKYGAIFTDYEDKGIIEPCEREEEELFLPHHAVINTKKIRPVVDASAKTKGGDSLNDQLLRGPVILPLLVAVLLRFRNCRYPLLADVQAAFHAIEIDPEDRRFCKIMWLKDINSPLSAANLAYMRFTRVVFGAVCSPFLLGAVLLHHFAKYKSNIAREMEQNTYVDNVLLQCETEEEALDKGKEAKQIFQAAQMNLREFFSHSQSIMEQIPEEDRLGKAIAKVLGVTWDTPNDTIVFELPQPPESQIISRRAVLSTLSSAFDPLGLIGPCLLPAKRLFQKLWEASQTWDSPLPREEAECWRIIINSWKDHNIILPRQAIPPGTRDLQLHVFCDASEHTFATSLYLRSESDNAVMCHLIFSKNRLKPRKARDTFTIPRLELLAILIGVRAARTIRNELHRPIAATHFWSDSRIALAWVRSGDQKQPFEQRRIDEIRQGACGTFHFLRSEDNPADIASRGATPAELELNAMWWGGPAWLRQPTQQWPNEEHFIIDISAGQQKDDTMADGTINAANFAARTEVADPPSPVIDIAKYSSIFPLLRNSLWCLRFIKATRRGKNCKFPTVSISGPFTGSDYRAARIFLIQQEQHRLLSTYSAHPTLINRDGLLCVKTRITNCENAEALAQPILLHPRSPLTALLVQELHEDLKHVGVDWTLSNLLCNYWMPKARRTVKKILQSCQKCRRMKAPPFARPEMPAMPTMRVRPARPFEYIGIDFLGPAAARHAGIPTKVWIIIISCMVTRGIYLEPTWDTSSLSCINVLRRFISRRGRPRRILSDNAPTFIQIHKSLDILSGPPPDTPPWEYAARKGIDWRFIPSYSPWMGATYERIVALVKNALQRTIGRRILDFDDLSAFLAEAEASINSRPITWVSDQPDAPTPLTPKDLIQNSGPTDIETGNCDLDIDDDNLTGPERLAALWKAYREANDECWAKWSTGYLLLLRERAGWHHKGPRLQTRTQPFVGQIVLVEEDLRPRNLWPQGRIVALNGTPPNVRSVQVKLGNGKVYTRPISRLCPLELENETQENMDTIDNSAPPMVAEEQREEQAAPPSTANPVDDATPTQPAPTGHRMITRGKAKTVKATALLTFFCLILISTSSATFPWFGCLPLIPLIFSTAHAIDRPCDECHLACTTRGIIITNPPDIQKVAVCCMHNCVDRIGLTSFTYELSPDILVNEYSCEAWFWANSEQSHIDTISCPAIDECELIDCTFCTDQMANPMCNPRLAAWLYFISIFTILSFCGCCLSCLHSARWLVSIISNCIAFFLSGPFRLVYRLAGRRWHAADREAVAQNIELGARRVGQEIREKANKVQRKSRNWQRALRLHLTAVLIIFLARGTEASETISIISQTESCERGDIGLTCSITTATTLTLLPAGQTSTLLLRDAHGITLGTLTLQLNALDMACHQKSEAWLRSYSIEHLSIKRCPRAGSCFGDHCGRVRPDTIIAELRQVQHLPGNSFCYDSTSFWGNDCALPAAACLYHRYFVRPSSAQPYELVSCPGWDLRIGVHLQLESNGGRSKETALALHPGMTQRWGNISITALTVSLPPMPVLNSFFLSNGRSVAIVENVPHDLHCENEYAARTLNCSLALSACEQCFPEHTEGRVDCHCREAHLDSLIETLERRLPLTVAKTRLRNEGPTIIASFVYAPIQLHVQMKDVKLLLQFRDSKCWIEDTKVTGCYKCTTGAQVDYTCRSDNAFPLATIRCPDNTVFVAHCSPNGTRERQILPFNHQDVSMNCIVDCPAGETEFVLNGTLHYIPIRQQFGHRQRTSELAIADPDTSNWWPDIGFDTWAVIRFFGNGPVLIGMALASIAAIIIVFVFIRCFPIFRIYRAMIRVATLLAIIPATHAGEQPSKWLQDAVDKIITLEMISWVLHITVGATAIFAIISILWLLYHLIPQPIWWAIRRNRRQERAEFPMSIRSRTLPLILFLITPLLASPPDRNLKFLHPTILASQQNVSLATPFPDGLLIPTIISPFLFIFIGAGLWALLPRRNYRIHPMEYRIHPAPLIHHHLGLYLALTSILFFITSVGSQSPSPTSGRSHAPRFSPLQPASNRFTTIILSDRGFFSPSYSSSSSSSPSYSPFQKIQTSEIVKKIVKMSNSGNGNNWGDANSGDSPRDHSAPPSLPASPNPAQHRQDSNSAENGTGDPEFANADSVWGVSREQRRQATEQRRPATNNRPIAAVQPFRYGQTSPIPAYPGLRRPLPRELREISVPAGGFGVSLRNTAPPPRNTAPPPPPTHRRRATEGFDGGPDGHRFQQRPRIHYRGYWQRLDMYLQERFGPVWYQRGEQVHQAVENRIRIINIRLRSTGELIHDWTGVSRHPTRSLLIAPGWTVAQYYQQSGRPIENVELPALMREGGLRGFGPGSRRRQHETGRIPWNYGMPHVSYHPLQFLETLVDEDHPYPEQEDIEVVLRELRRAIDRIETGLHAPSHHLENLADQPSTSRALIPSSSQNTSSSQHLRSKPIHHPIGTGPGSPKRGKKDPKNPGGSCKPKGGTNFRKGPPSPPSSSAAVAFFLAIFFLPGATSSLSGINDHLCSHPDLGETHVGRQEGIKFWAEIDNSSIIPIPPKLSLSVMPLHHHHPLRSASLLYFFASSCQPMKSSQFARGGDGKDMGERGGPIFCPIAINIFIPPPLPPIIFINTFFNFCPHPIISLSNSFPEFPEINSYQVFNITKLSMGKPQQKVRGKGGKGGLPVIRARGSPGRTPPPALAPPSSPPPPWYSLLDEPSPPSAPSSAPPSQSAPSSAPSGSASRNCGTILDELLPPSPAESAPSSSNSVPWPIWPKIPTFMSCLDALLNEKKALELMDPGIPASHPYINPGNSSSSVFPEQISSKVGAIKNWRDDRNRRDEQSSSSSLTDPHRNRGYYPQYHRGLANARRRSPSSSSHNSRRRRASSSASPKAAELVSSARHHSPSTSRHSPSPKPKNRPNLASAPGPLIDVLREAKIQTETLITTCAALPVIVVTTRNIPPTIRDWMNTELLPLLRDFSPILAALEDALDAVPDEKPAGAGTVAKADRDKGEENEEE